MKIVYNTPEGIAIIHPTPEALQTMSIEQIAQKDCPVADYTIVDDETIPSDHSFRNSWNFDKIQKKVGVDIPKAQEITKNRLRAERKPLLESLDVEVMKNITNQTKLAEIETEKQRLRDITKVIDALTTVEELKAVSI